LHALLAKVPLRRTMTHQYDRYGVHHLFAIAHRETARPAMLREKGDNAAMPST